MAEESFQERTEQPTARKKQQAREDGKIAKTQELSAGIVFVAAGLVITPAGGQLGNALAELTQASFAMGGASLSDPTATVEWLRWVMTQMAVGFMPFALTLGGLALLAGAAQAQGTFSTKALQPDWGRLSPVKNIKRFLSPRPVVDLIKALFKVGVVGAVVYVALADAIGDLSRLPQSGPMALVEVLGAQLVVLLLSAGLALLALALADYGYQTWQHQRELRMTKEEVRKELKEVEGDPLIRARLRSLGRSLARMRMMSAVPTADVVVTNPTHIAVALKYDPEVSDAPIIVAMGTRKIAERIRKIALDVGVPVIENKPVARALHATARIGFPIPPALYMAVAEILAFVYRQRGSAGASSGAYA